MFPAQIRTALKDDTPVLIRPVSPEDKHLLEIGFGHLSNRSRYLRFLRPVTGLSDQDLDYLTSTHGSDHVAFGALDLIAKPMPIGIARYIRLPTEPSAAEIAVTVVDDRQNRGLGRLLIGTLAACAVMHCVQTFIACVHACNAPMLRLVKDLDATIAMIEGAEQQWRIPLHRDPADYPRTLVGDAVRHAYELATLTPITPRTPWEENDR